MAGFGYSFGATWLYRVLQFDKEKLFDTAILDSLAPLEGMVAPENDEGLLDNCDKHPYCQAQFDGAARNARAMLLDILKPKGDNPCAAQLVTKLEDEALFDRRFTPLHKFYILIQPLMEGRLPSGKPLGGRTHPAQLVLAMIKNTHKCAEPETDTSSILEPIISINSNSGVDAGGRVKGHMPIASSGAKNEAWNRMPVASASSNGRNEINMVVNHLFFTSEAYDFLYNWNGKCGDITLSHSVSSTSTIKAFITSSNST